MVVNLGFTPDFQRVLASMGIDFSKMRAAANTQLASSQFAPIDWNPKSGANDPYFRLKAQGIDTHGENITQSGSVAQQIQQKQRKQGVIAPDVQKLYDSVMRMKQVEAARGAQNTDPKTSWWRKALDIISRPGRGVETGAYYGQEDVNKAKAQGKSFAGFRGFDEFAKGFTKGFTGKDQKTGADYLRKELGVKNKVALFAGGLGMDIATDPLTYVGLGIGKKAVDVGGKIAATRIAATTATDALRAGPALTKGMKIPDVASLHTALGGDITKVLTPSAKAQAAKTGAINIDKITSMLGAQAGRTAQVSIATDLTKLGLSPSAAKASSVRWLNPKLAADPAVLSEKRVYGNLIKTLPGMQATKYLDQAAPTLIKEAKDTASKQLTEVLNANLEQQVKRTLNVKTLGFNVPVAPIPAITIKALNKVAKTPVLAKTISAFDKAFNTGSGFDHELYITKSRAAGKAEQRINIGQQKLVDGFQGISKERRVGYMKALVSQPNTYGRGVVSLHDGRDMADLAQEVFDYVGKYIDWSGKGLGVIGIHKLNSYLPTKYKLDATILKNNPHIFNASAQKGSQNFLNLLANSKDQFINVDPQDFMFHLHIGTEKVLARDQFLRAIGDMGVPLKAANVIGMNVLKQGSSVAHQLVARHGYEYIPTKGLSKEVDPSFARYLDGKVFHPDIKQGLVKMIDMIDDGKAVEGFGRGYDRAMSYFKKSVTLPIPSYHIRNSVGDMFTSYVDGVTGARGMASYAQAAKILRFFNPVSKNQEIQDILTAGVSSAGTIEDPMKQIAALLGGRKSISGNLIMKKNPKWKDVPGQYVSAEQFMAAYQHTGLKRGFIQADLERELRGNPNLFMKWMHLPMDQVQKFSQQREDYFRMAHFIDRIKRSKAPTFEEAAKDAAFYVKKFHFDYTDVTPTERAVFARAIPFYKFQRFATPLMLQMFFAHPGKILNAQKVLNATALAQGYGNDGGFLPTADQILPEYMRDSMMIPLYENQGNTVFAGGGLLPSTTIGAQTLGLSGGDPNSVAGGIGRNIVQNATPLVQIPAEEYFGHRILGKGQIPITSQKDYLISKNPLVNVGFGISGDSPGKGTKIANILSGLGLSENTPARQKSELYRQRDLIVANRKKDKFTTKKPKIDTRGK